jgi:glycosyltransferase involved in cell wall biosynthesis/O-antigen/teichoic acid export membrane protein
MTQGHWPIFLLSSVSSLGNMFLPILLVRLMDPVDLGHYKIFFLYLATLPYLFMAGGPTHSVFFWVGKDGTQKESALNATWAWSVLLSLSIIALGYPFKHFIAEMLGMPENFVVTMLLAGALLCPSSHFTESAIAHGSGTKGSLFDIFFEVTKTAGFIFIAWIHGEIKYLFYFYTGLMCVKVIVSTLLNYRQFGISFKTDRSSMSKVFKYFIPVSMAGCLGFFVDKLDLLILSGTLDTTSFAFYSMGCLAIPPLYLLECSVQKILIPALSRAHEQQDWKGGLAHYRKAIGDIAFLIIPAVFGLITFARPIVKLLYTEEYMASSTYLRIFALSYLLLLIPHDSVARASGHTKWIFKMYLIITPMSLIIGYFSAKYWGAVGILIVSLFLKSIPKMCGLAFSKKVMNWKLGEMFPEDRLLKYTLLAAALSLVSMYFNHSFASDMVWLLLCSPIFAIIYLGFFNLKRPPQTHTMAKKTIVLFTPGPIGGAEKVIVAGQRALAIKSANVELWVIKENRVPAVVKGFEDLALKSSITYQSFFSNAVFDLGLFLTLRNRLNSQKPELLHAHGTKAAFYAWLARPKGCKLLVTHHGKTGHTLKVRVYEWLESLIMRNAHGVVAVSGEMRGMLAKDGVAHEKLFLIENLLTLQIHQKKQTASALGPLKLLFVGRLSPEKGCDVLIRSLSKVKADVEARVVGDGVERQRLENLCRNLGLQNKITFVGFQKDVLPHLQAADVLVMPSFREGQPLALIEALCMGLPVIASNVGGIPELIEDQQNGFLFGPGNEEELAFLIERAAIERADLRDRSRMKSQGMITRFAPETWADKTILTYKQVLIQV